MFSRCNAYYVGVLTFANYHLNKVHLKLMGILLVLQVLSHKPKYLMNKLKCDIMVLQHEKSGDLQSQ